jgi:hypothetical protein
VSIFKGKGMKNYFTSLLILMTIVLGGCAVHPQNPVQLDKGTLVSGSGVVGVAMTPLPKVDTHLPGASCLLCLAAAELANASLTSYTHTLTYEDLPTLKQQIADLLKAKGINAVVIDQDLVVDDLQSFSGEGNNIAKKDYSPLKQKFNIDKLVVVDITALGMIRTYSSYIPTSDPKAQLEGVGYMVDLASNSYVWYSPVVIAKSADGDWDESPSYPGLTNAYFQAIELGKDSFLKPFSK